MKRFNLTIGILLAVAAVSSLALAAMPGTKSGTVIQNLTGISPAVNKSRCDRFAAVTKRAAMKIYSTAGYTGVSYSSTDDVGADLPVKRRVNGGAAGLVKSSDTLVVLGHTNLAFDAMSTAAPGKNYNLCIDRQ